MNSSFTLQHFMQHRTLRHLSSPAFRSFSKEKIPFITRQTVVSVLYQTALRREREGAMQTFNLLYSLTIEALKAFHLWSSCEKIRELGLISSAGSVYLYFSSNQRQAICRPCIFSSVPGLPTIISNNILCANAVIDTFITSKGIQFSFQSSSGMNSATSSAANNEGPLPRAKGWLAISTHSRGNCVKLFSDVVPGERRRFQTG